MAEEPQDLGLDILGGEAQASPIPRLRPDELVELQEMLLLTLRQTKGPRKAFLQDLWGKLEELRRLG